MPPVKEKQRRSQEESWRQTSRYLRVKNPLQLLVKIEKTHWGCSSILQISSSSLWTSVCALWSVVQEKCVLAKTGTNLSKFCLRNLHPKEAIEAIGHPHLEVVERHSRLEDREAATRWGGPKSVPPKIPRIPHDCLRPPESGWISWIQRILEWQSGFRASIWHQHKT